MRAIIVLVALVILGSCKVEPEQLHFGQDPCYTCKMTLMDKKFGAEVVTSKGKIYKFDDINCMINFLNSGFVDQQDIAYRLVIDFAEPDKLIAAEDAFYAKTSEIKSPMASQVAAFSNKEVFDSYNKQWKGIYLSWGELITQFK